MFFIKIFNIASARRLYYSIELLIQFLTKLINFFGTSVSHEIYKNLLLLLFGPLDLVLWILLHSKCRRLINISTKGFKIIIITSATVCT